MRAAISSCSTVAWRRLASRSRSFFRRRLLVLEARAHDGERRAQLVRGIGGEAPHARDAGVEARERAVHRRDDRPDLGRHACRDDALPNRFEIDALGRLRRPPQRAERLAQPEEHDDAGGRPSDEESDRLVELVPNDEVDDVEPMEPEAARRDIIGTVRGLRQDGDAPLSRLGAVGRAKMQIARADALRVDQQPMELGMGARRQLRRIRGHGGIDEIGILGDPALQALRRSQAGDASTGRLERVEDELVDVMKRIILEHCILRAVSLRQGREIGDDGPGKECADELREDEIDDQPRRERLHLLHRSFSAII
jgi:hypothetical protein